MLAILSPARNLRPAPRPDVPLTRPVFAAQAQQLAKLLRQYSPWQLESLLELGPERAFQMYEAYQAFRAELPGTAALLAYWGAAFRSMAPQGFTAEDLAFAQRHLRILSALYGLLRPLDGILPHRLNMTRAFRPGGQDLYAFWGPRPCRALYAGENLVVNLASAEYARLIVPHLAPPWQMLNCRFLQQAPGGARSTVATVRAARGLMARYIVENRVNSPRGLQDFNAGGYRFAPALSGRLEYVFVKPRGIAPG